jgi:phage-related protein (TIGR01555 family)
MAEKGGIEMARKNRRSRKQTTDKKPSVSNPQVQLPRGLTTDSFSNVLARTGFGTPNLLEATEYPLTRLTNNYQLLNSLYRSNGIVRRVVDTIPEDATSNWITVQSQIDPEDLRKVEALWSTRRIKQQILKGLIWGRLYGGALGIIMIEGHEDELHTALDFDDIMPGTFKGLYVVDRWSGCYPNSDIVEDINDLEFGLPNSYDVEFEGGERITVHHTRAIRFVGRDLPYWEKLAEVHWGASEVEITFDSLKMFDNTLYNIASLIFNANLKVLQMEDLGQLLAVGDEQSQREIYNTVQAQATLQSSQGMMLLSKDDNFSTYSYSFAGVSDTAELFMMKLSADSKIPQTKLFGTSPAGMNATGESDMQNYYEVIQQYQESYVSPVIDKLLPIMFMSELGAIPDDYDYVYRPVREPDDTEIADLVKNKGDIINQLFTSGILSQKQALMELKDIGEPLGMFQSITDEDIENADDSTDMGEMLPGGGDLDFGYPGQNGFMGTEEKNRNPVQTGDSGGNLAARTILKWFRRTNRYS